MECKSCGSVRFKNIKPTLYECEYCGRTIELYSPDIDTSIGNTEINPLFGMVVLDPTRTLKFQMNYL